MHLHAAIVPPAEVVAPLTDLVRRIETPRTLGADSRRLRLFPRRARVDSHQLNPPLDVQADDEVYMPITSFGHVTSWDAKRLLGAVAQACETMDPPRVRVTGGQALVEPHDRHLWAGVSGAPEEISQLSSVAAAVVSGVERVNFFCDRRQFRPRLAVATINDATTAALLECVLAALDAYDGAYWNVDQVAILQRSHDARKPSTVWATVPIGVGRGNGLSLARMGTSRAMAHG